MPTQETGNNFVETEPESMVWNTDDELTFVRHLYQYKNLRALINYRRMLPYRNFYGPGMYVDVRLVQLSCDTHIEALEADLL